MIRRKDGVSRTATMSDATNSPSRIPASNPSFARSTSSSLAAISTDTSGDAAQKDASSGRSTTGTTARGTANRSRPDGFAPRSLAALLAAIISWNAGCARCRKRSPASVKPTLRVVRVNRAIPTRASSARTAWLTIGCRRTKTLPLGNAKEYFDAVECTALDCISLLHSACRLGWFIEQGQWRTFTFHRTQEERHAPPQDPHHQRDRQN